MSDTGTCLLSSFIIFLLSFLGVFSLLKLFIPIFRWAFTRFLIPRPTLTSYGSWALVTGASNGIGEAFAHQLANHGLNLLLLSRNTEKLHKVSRDIEERFPRIRTRILAVNFSEDARTWSRMVEDEIRELDIGVLINNVGVTYPSAMFFHEVDGEIWMNLIRVNIQGTTWMSRVVLRGMVQRGRGAVVNIGSGAATVLPSHPLYAIYAATKGYVDQLSESLHLEYGRYGIHVQCQVPLYVATKMASRVASIDTPSLFVPSAEQYTKAAVKQIGVGARCAPYWTHSLEWFVVRLLPQSLLHAWRLSLALRRRKCASPKHMCTSSLS